MRDDSRLVLRTVDGYAPTLSVADARTYRFIVATHLDGMPMPLGGLGPQSGRKRSNCPWGLYHIEAQ